MPKGNEVFKNDGGRWALRTEIEIDAPPHLVWDVLTDFEEMPKWSSQLQGIDGDFVDGGSVEARFLMNGRERTFAHSELMVEPGRSFGWSDPYAPGLTDHHIYYVESLDGGARTRFGQTDVALGPVGRLMGKRIMGMTMDNYAKFDAELKARVEALASQMS